MDKFLGFKTEEILTCLLLVVVGYFIARMFSRCGNGFSVGAQRSCTPDSYCHERQGWHGGARDFPCPTNDIPEQGISAGWCPVFCNFDPDGRDALCPTDQNDPHCTGVPSLDIPAIKYEGGRWVNQCIKYPSNVPGPSPSPPPPPPGGGDDDTPVPSPVVPVLPPAPFNPVPDGPHLDKGTLCDPFAYGGPKCGGSCSCTGAHYGPATGEKPGEKKPKSSDYPFGHVPFVGQCRTNPTCWESKTICETSASSVCYKGNNPVDPGKSLCEIKGLSSLKPGEKTGDSHGPCPYQHNDNKTCCFDKSTIKEFHQHHKTETAKKITQCEKPVHQGGLGGKFTGPRSPWEVRHILGYPRIKGIKNKDNELFCYYNDKENHPTEHRTKCNSMPAYEEGHGYFCSFDKEE